LRRLRGAAQALFEGVSDEDVAACLRVFAVLEERMGVRSVQSLPPSSASAREEQG